jgi:hypothetical protein
VHRSLCPVSSWNLIAVSLLPAGSVTASVGVRVFLGARELDFSEGSVA